MQTASSFFLLFLIMSIFAHIKHNLYKTSRSHLVCGHSGIRLMRLIPKPLPITTIYPRQINSQLQLRYLSRTRVLSKERESKEELSEELISNNKQEDIFKKPEVPEVYPQLLALPISRRPLFPGFYKAVVVKNPQVTAAIKELFKKGQPYVGAFLTKNDEVDIDKITHLDQVYPTGVFAQITSIFPAGAGSEKLDTDPGLTAVLYPHRRIQLTELLSKDNASFPEKKTETNKGKIY
jgi:hypothetical protein